MGGRHEYRSRYVPRRYKLDTYDKCCSGGCCTDDYVVQQQPMVGHIYNAVDLVAVNRWCNMVVIDAR
jgi:hypothetical protein